MSGSVSQYNTFLKSNATDTEYEKHQHPTRSLYVLFLEKWKNVILVVTLIMMIPIAIGAFKLSDNTSKGGITDPNSESTKASLLFSTYFVTPTPDVYITLEHPEWTVQSDNFTDAYYDYKETMLGTFPSIYAVVSPFEYPDINGFVSSDEHKAMAQVRIKRSSKYSQWSATTRDSELTIGFYSDSMASDALSDYLISGLKLIEYRSFPVLFVFMIFTYGGLVAVIIPTFLAIFTLACTLCALYLVSTGFSVTNYVTNVAAAFGVGIAIDYTIFLHLRFTEEMKRNRGNPHFEVIDAVDKMLMTSGRTVLYSAILLITTLSGALQFTEYYLTTMSLTMMFIAAFAALGALTFLPCVFLLLGENVFKYSTEPIVTYIFTGCNNLCEYGITYYHQLLGDAKEYDLRQQQQRRLEAGGDAADENTPLKDETEENGEFKTSHHTAGATSPASSIPNLVTAADLKDPWFIGIRYVLKHSVFFLSFLLACMVVLSAFFCADVKFAGFSTNNLPTTDDIRITYESVKSDFTSEGNGQLNIFLETSSIDTDFLIALDEVCTEIENHQWVTSVTSIVRFDSTLNITDYIEIFSNLSNPTYENITSEMVSPFYLTDLEKISRVTVALSLKDSDIRVGRTVRFVRGLLTSRFKNDDGTSMLTAHGVTGSTAVAYDLLIDIRDNLAGFMSVMGIAMLLFVILLTGSLVLPLIVVITSFLSIASCFCFLMFIFQDNAGSDFLNFYNNMNSLDELQLLFVFAVAFGISLDYVVFILGRIQEIYENTGQHEYAIIKGVSSSARAVTMAAILLCTAIGGLLATEVLVLKLIGLGIGLTVVFDATIVRCIFLPAVLGLLGEWTWWAPPIVKKVVSYLNIREKE